MARRNKKHGEHENHERWLITYADLITLLLIFFVIMYAMSKVDMEKYAVLSQSLHMQFSKADSVMPMNKGVLGQLDPGKGQEGDDKKLQQSPPPSSPSPSPSQEEQEQQKRDTALRDLLVKINQYIAENKLEAQVSAGNMDRGVVIKLNDMVLFDLGKADLKPEAQPILDKLASLFPTLNTKISIEGHTDNLPLATGSFYRDNLGLSQARSGSVLRYLASKDGLTQNMFVSTAYGETMPLVPNDSEENRSKNRRVEIVVLREPVKAE